MREILKKINEYNQIILYRHVNPDLDAFGSQFGLYWTLKNLFKEKNIVLEGVMDSELLGYYPSFDKGTIHNEKSLAIVLDTANKERIDGHIEYCEEIIKIDHHVVVDSYGNINRENETASSCSEIITLLFKQENITIPMNAANALYLGIVGDSNRFLYSSTSTSTFEAASYLLASGIDINALYQSLYMKTKKDLEVVKYIYNHYQSKGKIAWFYLSDNDLKELHITREQGSQFVNTLANYEEFCVWMAVTENKENSCFRVSIRSRNTDIREIASRFHGGGHAFASGATLYSLDELEELVRQLEVKVNG
jgi:Exopolyphosphatase-related proteins